MDNFMYSIIFIFIIFLGIMFKAWYEYISNKHYVHNYLKEVTDQSFDRDKNKKRSLLQRVIKKSLVFSYEFSDIGERFNFYSESDEISRLLIYANHPLELTVRQFQGLKIVLFLFGTGVGLLTVIIGFPFSYLLVVLLPFLSFFGPIIWIRQKANKRQAELSYTLPDFLDMVSVTLKAGASLDQALTQISSHFEGPIKEEFARFSHRLQLGIPREEVYKELIVRTDVPEFEAVIKSLIRGSRLGIPVATTFEIQAEEIRRLRKEKVKEAASKSAPKVTLITTFIVMPTAFLIIGGLVLLNVIDKIKDISIF